jgi:hypothetical protein
MLPTRVHWPRLHGRTARLSGLQAAAAAWAASAQRAGMGRGQGGHAGWAVAAVPHDGLGGNGAGQLGLGRAQRPRSRGRGAGLRGCWHGLRQRVGLGSGVGLGHGSWAAHCGAGKRALAGGLGWPEQASRPGKQVERGGAGEQKLCWAGGGRKRSGAGPFSISSLDYFLFFLFIFLHKKELQIKLIHTKTIC